MGIYVRLACGGTGQQVAGYTGGMQTTNTARVLYNVSAITKQLFIAARPRAHHMEHVHGLGVDLVLSMIGVRPPQALAEPPFRLLRLPVFDNRFLPIPVVTLQQGVSDAMPVLDAGGRVLVYCRAGRHRSVADSHHRHQVSNVVVSANVSPGI